MPDSSVIYKPLRRGRVLRDSRVSLIYTNLVEVRTSERFEQVAYAPSLFQKYVSKSIEIRVTVIGSKVYAVRNRLAGP